MGGFEIEGLEPGALGSRKARTLLKALALARGRPVAVDSLVEWLWPRSPPASPADQVSVLVSRLRGVLGANRLVRSDAGYALTIDWLDLDALAELVEEASRRLVAGSPGLAGAAAHAALALARGPLLPEEPEAEWAEADRAIAVRLEGEARRLGAEAACAAGDLSGAALMAQRALDHDPYDEVALRTLMMALAESGRPASALAAYATARSRLSEDLGVDPTSETEALHTSILLAPPPVAPPDGARPEPAALPGRAGALARLDTCWSEAGDGRGGLVVVEGEAGIGKSRLLSVWAAGARAGRDTVLSGRCEELAQGLPLDAVLSALGAHLGAVGPEEASEILGPEAGVLGPLLGRDTRASVTTLSAPRDEAVGQLRIFAGLVAALGRLPAPVALVIDDAHLAGAATVEWLQYAARRAADQQLLLVCAQRSEEAISISATSRVHLGPLDEEAAAEVVGSERAGELARRSGGNPLFLVELAAADPTESLPATVRQAVIARCDRAGPAAAASLRTAALLGPVVDLDLLAAVLRASPVDLLDHLEQGVRRGLLEDRPGGFAFRHDVVREALEAEATASRRAFVHREAGRVLAGRPRPDALAVAHHARQGGDDQLAASALVDAADVASARFDQPAALMLLDQSLALADSLRARLLRARVLILSGDYRRAAGEADVAVGMGGGATALELGAWAAHYRRDFATAVRLADEGVDVAADVEEAVRCRTMGGWACQCTGDLPAAEERLEEARRLSRGVWRPVTGTWLGALRVHQGRCAEGFALIRPTTINETVVVQAQPALHAYLFMALALANLGRAEDALEAVAAIDAHSARIGAARWAGRADNTRGWILRGLGQWQAADEANAAGLERSIDVGMLEPAAHAHLDLAAGALVGEDLDRAAREVEASEALGSGHAMAWRHGLRARLYRGEIALDAGETTEAEQAATEVLRESQRIGTARYTALASLLLARSRFAAGEEVAEKDLDRLLGELREVAGMEAWRLTAKVAVEAKMDRWWSLAEMRVAELAARAGPYADSFQRVAGTTLARMRTPSRRR
jgi:DNA-binding SARP family transcriptional activator/tetratricopeptide (TPR) repeat protein